MEIGIESIDDTEGLPQLDQFFDLQHTGHEFKAFDLRPNVHQAFERNGLVIGHQIAHFCCLPLPLTDQIRVHRGLNFQGQLCSEGGGCIRGKALANLVEFQNIKRVFHKKLEYLDAIRLRIRWGFFELITALDAFL